MDSADKQRNFSLLETMRLERGGVARLERHLSRMAETAGYFDFPWRAELVRRAVAAVEAAHPEGCWRVRLLLSSDGQPTIECTPLVHDRQAWRVAFAAGPIDRDDPFICFKTTHRVVYESAKEQRTDVDEVLLWNANGEVTEFTIGNVVAEVDGERLTPPVESGLLAGTFRAELLAAGNIRERVLTKTDVASAPRLWLVNSLRGWVDVTLVP